MRWTSSISRRSATHARRLCNAYVFRPMMEQLEDRMLRDTAFANLANYVAGKDGPLATLQDGLAAVTTKANLPVIDRTMNSVAGSAQTALQKFRNGFQSALGSLDSTKSDTDLTTDLYNKLLPLRVLRHNSPSDVQVTRDANGLTVTLNVGKVVKAGAFNLGLGLPGVPLQVDAGAGALQVQAGFAYDQLTFGLGADGKTPFFDADRVANEFQVTVTARLDPSAAKSISGSLGFLKVTATDAGTNLTGNLVIDVQGKSATDLRLTNSQLNGSADINLDIVANVGTAQLPKAAQQDAQYPSVSTKFRMHWDLNGSSPTAERKDLGQEPSIEFRDVTIDLGNQGTYIGAAVLLYQQTKDKTYLDEAIRTAEWTKANLCVTDQRILRSEGQGDGGAFKGIFARYMRGDSPVIAHDVICRPAVAPCSVGIGLHPGQEFSATACIDEQFRCQDSKPDSRQRRGGRCLFRRR
jgi:hypothetical protein